MTIRKIFAEDDLEEVVLEWLADLGYTIQYGPEIAPDGERPERASYDEVILLERLKTAIDTLNPKISKEAREEALRKVTTLNSPVPITNNHKFHQMLRDGIDVEYRRKDGSIAGDKVLLFDFDKPKNNDWLAVNQFTVIDAHKKDNRRPDVVIFVNGLPLVVIELKNPIEEKATWESGYNQFQTYKEQIPALFYYNQFLVTSDGLKARAGTITADKERFMPWKTIDGVKIAPNTQLELETLTHGMFEKGRFLDLIKNFIVFEKHHERIIKKIAGYHQYHAVNKAIETTITAASQKGDKRCGVIWHTQGSGKSLTMAFYAGKLILRMDNPTIVVLTDRNDLDEQLFDTFSNCQELLRQTPKQAKSRTELRDLLKVAAGGVVFTTIQKFLPEVRGDKHPLLSERRNIIVIVDEAHRSQYDFIDGFAKHLRDAVPNASFIGFTGTPIEKADKSTPAIFGKYIDTYDIERAVQDGATVKIYYEGRLAKLELKPEEVPKIDPKFEELTEGEESDKKEKLKTSWARLEAVVGTDKRIKRIAKDIVDHFEKRLEVLQGKGMIVCMSRRICVELYKAIIKLRPHWHSADDKKGFLKVVMTGSASDLLDWQQHIRTKKKREALADRMKDANDPLKLVIVRDMWLTGFDVPSMHTMYIDKPMRGHNLMQAIARVNRVFKDKPGGRVVDYLGIADQLRIALGDYTVGNRGQVGIPEETAVALMQEKHEVVRAMFHKFDYSKFAGVAPKVILQSLPAAMDHIIAQKDGKTRYLNAVTALTKAFALAVPHEDALKIRDDVLFFQAVRSGLAKTESSTGKSSEQLDTAVQQIISQAIASEKVVDIFKAAGLKSPDISILSDEFLAEVQKMPYKNLAMELLQKLLNDEISTRTKKNLIQARSFAQMLEMTLQRYQNRSIETAQVITELINIAKEIRAAQNRGDQLNLSDDEVAFYDALETNDSAVQVLGDTKLKTIARELVHTIKDNITIDWTLKESVQAKMRVTIKRLLKKYGYPPDKQEKATQTVLEQAKLICSESTNNV